MISGLILKSLIHFEIFLYVVWESSPDWFSAIDLPSFPTTIYWRGSCILGCRLVDCLSVDFTSGLLCSITQKSFFPHSHLRGQYSSKGHSSTQSLGKLVYLSSKASGSAYYQTWLVPGRWGWWQEEERENIGKWWKRGSQEHLGGQWD